MQAIADRLKEVRAALGLTQAEMALKFALPIGSLRKYESGPSEPGSAALAGISRAGINTNWLLTGDGPMLLADLVKPDDLDMARLRMAVETVEEGLSAARATMESGKKADLVLAVYDLLEEPGVSKERVLKLVKLAA